MAVAAAGLIVVPGVAAAAVVHVRAETGQFGRAGFTENDTSQYIDMCAPDVRRYVGTLEPVSRPLPPGTTWDGLASRYVATFAAECPPAGPGAVTQVSGIRDSLLAFSECPWEEWAIDAPASSAAADLKRADTILADTEVAKHEVNPHGTSTWQTDVRRYGHASRGYLDYDYQVNCLGRDTAANPPTVPDPSS